MEALSPHVTVKCVTSSSTLINNPSPLPIYVDNPSSIRAASDQRRRHFQVGSTWRRELTLSSETYGKSRLTPSLTSDLEMLTRIHIIMIQWIISCIVGRSKIGISTVSTSASNRKNLHLSSQRMTCLGKRL